MTPDPTLQRVQDARGTDTMPHPDGSAPELSLSPYKGLTPYTAQDTDFFFGRASETKIITANLIAERLTLLYGPSGVGKSSVLQAGVVHTLQERARRDMQDGGAPEYIVVYFNSWRDRIVPALLQAAAEAVRALLPVELSPATTLVETLRAWSAQTGAEFLFILDQFEEYFLYPEDSTDPGSFSAEFPRAVQAPDLRADFLLSFREDALAQLDRFEGDIPRLFKNIVRLKHLDVNSAREAIVEPIHEYNRRRPTGVPAMQIEPALVEAVLNQVRVGQVVVGESGRGGVSEASRSDEIETPYLQLVMTRIWDQERQSSSNVLRLATLERLQGAQQIVRTHLDATMASLPPQEQLVAARAFRYLVTPSGTKISYSVRDLATYTEVPEKQLEPVLVKLAGSSTRVLRGVASPAGQDQAPRFEIFHDVLGPAILDWRQRYLSKARERRLRIILFSVGGLSVVVLAVALWFWFTTPKQLPPGSYNIAVAEFGEIDAQGRVSFSAEGQSFRSLLASRMELQLADLTLARPFAVSRVGPVQDAKDAERLAKELRADLVIYGKLETRNNSTVLTPQFFIRSLNGGDLTGPTHLGAPITFPTSQLLLEELVSRFTVLVPFDQGSEFLRLGEYKRAVALFEQAANARGLDDRRGKDVIYTYLGTALTGQSDISAAQAAFEKALAINPGYAPAYVGLGNIALTNRKYDQATDYFTRAGSVLDSGSAPDNPRPALVQAGIHLGLGTVYLAQAQAGADELFARAESEFQSVLLEYRSDGSDALRIPAAKADFALGNIRARSPQGYLLAERYFEECINTASSLLYNPEIAVRAACQNELDRLRALQSGQPTPASTP